MEGPAFNARSFEELFNNFIRTQTTGHRLDELTATKVANDAKCADYFFPDEGIIVELKTLNEDHGDRQYLLTLAKEAAARLGYSESVVGGWLSGQGYLPEGIERVVRSKVQNSIKNAVRKANDQIKSTRSILKKRHDSVLIVANLGEHLFGPVELLRSLAGLALGRTSLSIDTILLITPGVAYSPGDNMPQHYIAPVYAEGKTYLGDFVEPLSEKWIAFEAAALGLRPEIEKVYELDPHSKVARPANKGA